MNQFKIAAGGVLFAIAVSTVLTFALGRSAPPPVIVAAEPEPPPSIDEQLREIGLSALRQSGEDTRIVATEKVIPPVIPTVNIAKPRPVEVSVIEQKKAESNICTRHGRRKVWVTKYKWKCLK